MQSQPASSPLTVQIVEAQLLQIECLQHGQDNNSALMAVCGKQTQNSTPVNSPSPNKDQCQNCHKGFHTTENCQAPGGAKEGIPYPEHERKLGAATATFTWEKSSHAFLATDRDGPQNNTLSASQLTLDHLILDSGCSIHMPPHEDWFIPGTLKKLPHSHSIHVANGHELKATVSGTLKVDLSVNGTVLEGRFANTLLIPELSSTLISIWRLTQNHHHVTFKDNWAEVTTQLTGKVVAKAILGHGGIYVLQTQHNTPMNIPHCQQRWHQ